MRDVAERREERVWAEYLWERREAVDVRAATRPGMMPKASLITACLLELTRA